MSRTLTGVVWAGLLLGLVDPTSAAAQGHFEVGVHVGKWSLNVLKPAIEGLSEEFGEQIKDKQVDKILEEHPGLRETSFVNRVEFDSSGNNVGFELRWYPGGEKASFSIGIAGERTAMRMGLTNLSTDLSLEDDRTRARYTFNSRASGEMEAKPFAVMTTLRWDILPSHRVQPYISIGGGVAGVSALDRTTLNWQYSGTLASPGLASVEIADASRKTLQQLKTEEDFDYPIGVFPFVQLNLGIKAKVTKSIHLLFDAGILDGVLLRAGLALRL